MTQKTHPNSQRKPVPFRHLYTCSLISDEFESANQCVNRSNEEPKGSRNHKRTSSHGGRLPLSSVLDEGRLILSENAQKISKSTKKLTGLPEKIKRALQEMTLKGNLDQLDLAAAGLGDKEVWEIGQLIGRTRSFFVLHQALQKQNNRRLSGFVVEMPHQKLPCDFWEPLTQLI